MGVSLAGESRNAKIGHRPMSRKRSFFPTSRTTLTAAFLKWSNHTGNHCTGLPATGGTGAADFNWSSSVSTLCQRTWFFFVSIGTERSA